MIQGKVFLISFPCSSYFPLVVTPGGFAVSFRRLDNRRQEVVKSKSSQAFLMSCLGKNLLEEEMKPMLWDRIGILRLHSGVVNKSACTALPSLLCSPRL